MSKTSVPFSPKAKELIREGNQHHRDPNKKAGMLDPIIELFPETGLGLKGKDPESRIDSVVLSNGDVKVSFIYVLDNNGIAEDGRLYLRDEFILESETRGLKTYQRKFLYNGKGKPNQGWEKYLGLYRGLEKPSLMGRVEFSHTLARHQAIPLSSLKGFVPGLGETGKKYLVSVAQEAQKVYPKATLKILDPQSYYSVIRQGSQIEITLSMVFDNDQDPKNGRAFFRETYTLDAHTHRLLQNVKRNWDMAFESRHHSRVKKFVEAMNQKPSPGLRAARDYADTWIPLLLQTKSIKTPPKKIGVPAGKTYHPPVKELPPRREKPIPSPSVPHGGKEIAGSTGILSLGYGKKSLGNRSVTLDRVKWKAGKLALPHYKIAIKKRPFPMSVQATLEIDNATGNLRRISFHKVETGNERLPQDKIKGMLKRMADEIYRGLSLEKQVGRKTVVVKTEFKFVPAN